MRKWMIWGAFALAVVAGLGLAAVVRQSARGHAEQVATGKTAQIVDERPVVTYPSAFKAVLVAQRSKRNDAGEVVDTDRWRKVLTDAQRKSIESNIVAEKYGPGERYLFACCVPHHALEYYDAKGVKVGEISICFCCACIRDSPSITIPDGYELGFRYNEMKAAIEALGVPTNIHCDE